MTRTKPFSVIAHDAQPPLEVGVKPVMGAGVIDVVAVEERDKHVDVEQGPAPHSGSSSRSRPMRAWPVP